MCGLGVCLCADRRRAETAGAVLGQGLAHRGPDSAGEALIETGLGRTLAFAHRRLAIIDLSPAGHQPMSDESGNAIVFNGEIYNHADLRQELEAGGEVFRGASDTEVLLRGYRRFGLPALLRRLRGMFAFALWDAASRRLLLVRDPCGIKPLYYVNGSAGFAAASEVRALVSSGMADGGLDLAGLDSLLAFGSVQPPLTLVRGVRSLLPGSLLWVEGDGRVGEPVRYWSWADQAGGAVPDLAGSLKGAIRRHLVSDVPVALFLSGGYDSAALAALAGGGGVAEPLRSFTVSFPDNPAASEGTAAARIAGRFGLVHTDLPVTAGDALAALPGFLAAQDQPSDDGLNVYLISRAVAGQGVKVALHGLGGDELFGGYPSFRDLPRTRWLGMLPPWLRAALAAAVDGPGIGRGKIAELLRTDLSLLAAFAVRRHMFSYRQRRALLGCEPPLGPLGLPPEWLAHLAADLAGARDRFAATSLLELCQYAGNKLLPDGDVMSMAHGLELRVPLLDADLIRAALAMPESAKRSARGGKPALEAGVANFPHDLVGRGKRGFTLPFRHWLAHELRDECQSVLLDGSGGAMLSSSAVAAVWRGFLDKNEPNAWLRPWVLYVLRRWLARDFAAAGGAA